MSKLSWSDVHLGQTKRFAGLTMRPSNLLALPGGSARGLLSVITLQTGSGTAYREPLHAPRSLRPNQS